MEEESKFRVFWKKHYKIIFLFFIRLTEVFVSSIVPSSIGVILMYLNPSDKIWAIINFLTLVGFVFINFRFMLKYIAGRDNKKEFYILNGIVYIIYIVVSILAYRFAGDVVYSMIFANLRGLEAFGMKPFNSILVCDAITLISMIILGKFAYRHMDVVKKILRMDGADEVEFYYDVEAPTRNSEEITLLSVEEMDKEIDRDMDEAAELIKQQQENHICENDNNKMSKGNNGEVLFVTPENPDDDIDETDHVDANADIIDKNDGYDADSLWEKDIYNGGEPITDYEDEDEFVHDPENIPSATDRLKNMLRHHIRSVTRTAVVNRNNRIGEAGFMEDEHNGREDDLPDGGYNEGYDGDSLWESRMYQGQNSENIPERVEDFDDNTAVRPETGLEDYDGGNLWDNIERKRILTTSDVIAEEDSFAETGFEDYSSDSLWNTDIYQGRRKKE